MENKSITNNAKRFLTVWNISLFLSVWFGYYNEYTFDTFYVLGGILSIVIFAIIYLSLCNLYKAYRIASSEIGETIFSQVLSFGIADFILYAECCLIHNRYVNLLPGIMTLILQIAGTSILVTFTKQYMIRHIPPKNTVIVYGKHITKEDVAKFKERLLKKYHHLFYITELWQEEDDKETFLKKKDSYDVVVLYEMDEKLRARYMAHCIEHKKAFYASPTVGDIMFRGCVAKHLLDTPLMKYEYIYENKTGFWKKRILDIVVASLVLIITSPILLLIALCIKLEDGGPVFFKQKRCTKDKRVFEILKFRSMIVDAEKEGCIPCTKNDSRITKMGNLIRKTRLDEMPQFINILKGDMSIVGPRPERVEHVEQYTKEVPEFAYRMKVLGGLTGYAQIYGKYNTSPYDKLRLDLLYIENQSLVLDVKLILLTLKTMFIPESTEGFEDRKSEAIREEAKQSVKLSMIGK